MHFCLGEASPMTLGSCVLDSADLKCTGAPISGYDISISQIASGGTALISLERFCYRRHLTNCVTQFD